MKIIKLGLLGLTLCFSSILSAQSISSPYSNYGVGEFLYEGLPHNYAMGQVGIGTPTPWHINLQNPAMLTYNTFSTFQVGLQTDFRRYATEQASSHTESISLRYLAMSYPIVRNKWSSALAVLPLTTTKYNTFSRDTLDNVARTVQYIGDGGLTQVVWANGFRLFDQLNVGVKAAYIFGNINKDSRVALSGEDLSTNYLVSYYETSRYSDINFSLGVSYQMKLKERNLMTFGAVSGLSKAIEGTQDITLRRLSFGGTIVQQQVIADGQQTEFTLPQYIGGGISYENLNKLRVGLDFTYTNWVNADDSDANEVRNTLLVAAGAEFIPDYQSVNSYLSRTSYRLGFNFKQLPYLENSTEINDFGINFGASFPVSGYSSMDVAFKYGFRGTTDNNLIRENYFQVVVGATINDRWFRKVLYD
ncbi:hypothetical protein [Marinoscillum sp.]|uniref:hypothetical protein n=1 Tax=Marinoscillum sp. TaxID=2024838 RepID=UPI003BA87083